VGGHARHEAAVPRPALVRPFLNHGGSTRLTNREEFSGALVALTRRLLKTPRHDGYVAFNKVAAWSRWSAPWRCAACSVGVTSWLTGSQLLDQELRKGNGGGVTGSAE
jgi:hypothetical protein